MNNIFIAETDNYAGLVRLFVEQGLEFGESDDISTDVVKCWQAKNMTDELVGGCVLAEREGRFICDGIATAPAARGLGLGARLLNTMLDEAKGRGAEALYLVARAPGFFAKHGFVEIPREEAPTFFECFSCPQYGAGCNPQVMMREIKEGYDEAE